MPVEVSQKAGGVGVRGEEGEEGGAEIGGVEGAAGVGGEVLCLLVGRWGGGGRRGGGRENVRGG